MSLNRSLFSSASVHWSTPKQTYEALEKEFGAFDFDPCPLGGLAIGLETEWKGNVFVNPPYGRGVETWVKKGYESAKNGGATVVMLLPSRTDTKWFHDYALKAQEVRFLRGRLKFGDAKNSAPFPSCLVIFRPARGE